MKYGINLLCFLLIAFGVAHAQVEVGEQAPLFEIADESGERWNLKDHIGEDFVVLYFYPAAMTGGCTAQACSYRDKMGDIKALDAIVVGVSGDNPENLRLFKKEHNLNFTLLSDAKGEAAAMYGVPVGDGGSIERKIDGNLLTLNREVTTSRWTFVIDKEGKIIYKNTDVKADEDSEHVIDAIARAKQN